MRAPQRLFVLLVVMVLGAACAAAPATSPAPSSTAAAAASPSATTKAHYDVVIAEIGQIGPVLQTVAGFKSALAAAGLVEGQNVTYSEKNAHGDQATVELMSRWHLRATFRDQHLERRDPGSARGERRDAARR